MKTILIGGGVVLLGMGLIVGFLIVVYSLKEDDEDLFLYLTIPISMCAFGGLMIYKAKRKK